MQLVDPFEQHDGRIVLTASLELRAHGVNERVQVKCDLGVEAAQDSVLDSVIDFLCEISDFLVGTRNQSNYLFKDPREVFVLKHKFPIALENIENSVARG